MPTKHIPFFATETNLAVLQGLLAKLPESSETGVDHPDPRLYLRQIVNIIVSDPISLMGDVRGISMVLAPCSSMKLRTTNKYKILKDCSQWRIVSYVSWSSQNQAT